MPSPRKRIKKFSNALVDIKDSLIRNDKGLIPTTVQIIQGNIKTKKNNLYIATKVGPRGGTVKDPRIVNIDKGDRLPPTSESGNN